MRLLNIYYFVLFLFLLPFISNAQLTNLKFSSTSSTYAELGSGTSLINGGSAVGAASAVTPIGFNFIFQGNTYSNFSVNAAGLLKLGNAAVTTESTNNASSTTNTPKIYAWWDATATVASANGGGVIFTVSGSAPNRVLTVQWKVAYSTSATSGFSYQVKLYESTNVIEYLYGAVPPSGTISASVGLGNFGANEYMSFYTFNNIPSSTLNFNANTILPGAGAGYKYTFTPSFPSLSPANLANKPSFWLKADGSYNSTRTLLNVPANRRTASSELNTTWAATNSVLSATNSWIPSAVQGSSSTPTGSNQLAALTLDLGSIQTIDGVATLGAGSNNYYVKDYMVRVSDDNVNYTDLGLFSGNELNTALRYADFDAPVTCRYVRIIPSGFETYRALRVDVYTKTSVNIANNTKLANWEDNSGNQLHAYQNVVASQPTFNTNQINFNPAVNFTNSPGTSLNIPDLANIRQSYWVAQDATASGNDYFHVLFGGGANLYGAATSPYFFSGLASAIQSVAYISTLQGSWRKDGTAGSAASTYDFGVQGKPNLISSFSLLDNAPFSAQSISFQAGTNRSWQGPIAEIITFQNQYSTNQQNIVETYLGVKYGITVGHDYVNPDGTILWNRTANTTYHNNVFGIGRSDSQGLHQRQSFSINYTGKFITLGNNSVIGSTNASSVGNSLAADNTYLLLGDNNAPILYDETPTGNYYPLLRKWKVSNVSVSAPTKISIPAYGNASPNALPFSYTDRYDAETVYLTVDTDGDGDFSNATYTAMTKVGTATNTTWDISLTLPDNAVIGFAVKKNTRDTDGDTIPDDVDIDDDNDGAIDSNEQTICRTLGRDLRYITFNGSAISNRTENTITTSTTASTSEWISSYSAENYSLPISLKFRRDAISGIAMLGLIPASRTQTPTNYADNGYKFYTLNTTIYGYFGTIWNFSQTATLQDEYSIEISASGAGTVKINGVLKHTFQGPVSDYKLVVSASSVAPLYKDIRLVNGANPERTMCLDRDTDNDGTPNRMDLDSDGDGCSDAVETRTVIGLTATTVTGPYGTNGLANSLETVADNGVYSGTYTYYNARIASIRACADTDGDTVADEVDIDDDNDGILDNVECAPFDINKITYAAQTFTVSNGNSSSQTFPAAPNGMVVNVWTLDNSFNVQINGTHLVSPNELEFWPPANANAIFEFLDGTAYTSVWTVTGNQAKPLIRVYINKEGAIKVYGSRTSGGALEEMRLRNGSFNEITLNTNSQNTFQIGQLVILQTYITGDFGIVDAVNCDLDGDGIPNGLDLDSDGDGCPDAKEAEIPGLLLTGTIKNGTPSSLTTTANVASAIASGTYGANGFADALETSTESGVYTAVYNYDYVTSTALNACTDSDNDGVNDIYDLDDDNDGVLDTVEDNCSITVTNKTGLIITKPLTINYNFNSNNITNLIDGVDANVYVVSVPTGTLSNSPWFNFEFPTPKALTYLEIGHYVNQYLFSLSSTYKIQGSTDNINWADVSGVLTYNNAATSTSGGLSSSNSNIANFSNNRKAYKYYRVYGVSGAAGVGWATEIYFKEANCITDSDGDGIPNRLDLDSDGDGCPDAREAGITTTLSSGSIINKVGNVTSTTSVASAVISGTFGANGFANSIETGSESGVYSGTYTYDYALDANISSCLDTDSDNIPDFQDIDDDNDGVLDATEYNCEVSTLAKTGITVSSTVTWGYNGTTLNNLVNGTEDLTAYTTGDFLNQTILQFNLPAAKVLEQIELSTQSGLTTLGTTGTYNIEGWNGTAWVVIEKNKTFGSPSTPIRAPGNTYKFSMPNNLTAYSKYRIFGTSAKGTYSSTSWIQEAYFFERACNTDVDNDGIKNWLDSDSDGDNCPDAVEAGTTAISTSGVTSNAKLSASTIPAPYSANGFATGLETTSGSGIYTGTYTYHLAIDASINACTDSDNDGIANAHDLDDDNDGVLDVTELNCASSIVAKTGISVSSTVTWAYTGSTLANLVNGLEDLSAYSTTDFIDQTILQFDFTVAKTLSLIEISTQNSGATLGTTGKYNVQGWNGSKWINILTNQTFAMTAPVLAPANSYTIKMPFNTTAYNKYRIFGTTTKGTVSTTTWIQEAYFTEQTCNLDLDGDGIPNTQDLDSDGDGCSDAVEAGTVSGTTATTVAGTFGANGFVNSLETSIESGLYSGTYTYQLAMDATISSCRDTDGDGVTDVNDIDDDNDGILDSIECPATEMITNGSFDTGSTGWTVGAGWTFESGLMANYLDGATNTKLSQTIGRPYPTTRPGYVDFKVDVKATGYNNIPSNAYTASLIMQVNDIKYATLTNPANGSTTATVQTFNGALSSINTFPVVLSSGQFSTVIISIPSQVFYATNTVAIGFTAGNDDFRIDNISLSTSPNLAACDTDRDGIPNSRDLDSDGDGCFDAVEAKTTYHSGSGVSSSAKLTTSTLTGATGTNGFIDGIETGTESGLYSGTYLYSRATDPTIKSCIDSDFDGVPDIDDLDDDNDGILDLEESNCTYTAQNTSGTWKGNFGSTVTASFTGAQVQTSAYSLSDSKYTYSVPANQGRAKFGAATFTLDFNPAIPSTELALYFGDVDAILNSNDPSFQIKVNGVNDNGTFIASSLNGVNPSMSYNTATGLANLSPRRNDAELLLRGNTSTLISSVQIITSNVHVNDLVGYNYFARNCIDMDTDGDGIPNRLDLDSDGDGCSDANEAYATTTAQGTDGNQQFGTNPITVDATGKITSATYTGTNSNYISAGAASVITIQPADRSTTPGGTVVFSANVTAGTGTTTYQWQVSSDGGNTWSNVTNSSTYAGAGTSTLTVSNVSIAMKGYRYQLLLSQSNYVCGNVTSSAAKILMSNTPSIVDDAKTGTEDTPLTGNVLTNDTGSGSPAAALTVTTFTVGGVTYNAGQTATIANVGTFVMNADGSFTFTPVANYNGSVPAIEYTATDANGGSDVGALALTITPVNDAPVAIDDAIATNENTPVSGNVLTTGTADSDADGNTLTITQFTINGVTYNPGDVANIPGKGSITMNANGSYTFTPTAGYSGAVPFLDYTLSDGNGGSDVGRLTITVNPVNDAPLATDDIVTILQGSTATGNLLTNDADVDAGATLTVTSFSFTINGTTYTNTTGSSLVTMPGIGTIQISANGAYSFVPSGTYTGTVPPISYTLSDGSLTDIGLLDIFVAPVNANPDAVNDVNSTQEDTPVSGNVRSNDTDAETTNTSLVVTQYSFTVSGVTYTYPAGSTNVIPGVGTLVMNADGTYTFTPFPNYNGAVPTITYTISDGNGGTDTGTLDINVTAMNDSPIAVNDDNKTTSEDTPVTVNVLANDSDIDGGNTLSVTQFTIAGINGSFTTSSIATIPNVGTVTVTPTGDLTFTPVINYNGPVPTITYTVTDGVATNTANVNIAVTPVNDAPTVSNETRVTPENTAITGFSVLTNDTDVETATASLTVTQITVGGVTYPAGSIVELTGVGSVIVNADGTYTFTPNRGYFGTVPVITYAVSDGNGGVTSGTLSITVTPVNDPPVVAPETVSMLEDAVATGNLLTNDSDPESNPLTITQFTIAGISGTFTSTATIPGVGTITINANGTYTFTPTANYNGIVPMIEYTVSDGQGASTNGNLTIVVAPVNDAPIVVNDNFSEPINTPISNNVLANDRDVEGSSLSVMNYSIGGVSYPAGQLTTIAGVGTIIINADGSFVFTPALNYYGSAPAISYTVSDGTATSTGTLSLTITPIDADGDGIPDATEKGSGSTPRDSDNDGTPDWLDTDSDNDGIPDSLEDAVCIGFLPCTPTDTDGDGTPDYRDLDSDGDGIADATEDSGCTGTAPCIPTDTDGDGTPNYLDLDSDGDGISDAIEKGPTSTPRDTDNDGTPDYLDTDSDGDGILDRTEGSVDTDGDGVPNYRDPDSDGDGISDAIEGTVDTDGDGNPNYIDTDSDGDGITDAIEKGPTGTPVDTDGDGTPDYKDLDSDNDGIPDSVEGSTDVDGDGIPNFRDLDSDGDGIADRAEGTVDTDGDGTPNFLDVDSDGDGIPDRVEGTVDSDGDGVPNYLDTDSDGDGILDSIEDAGCTGTAPCTPTDTDGDGTPNYLDLDSDGDGISDNIEKGPTGTPVDTDGDGFPDYIDLDSDGDGITDAVEKGPSATPVDTDGDGTPDFRDLDSDGDGITDAIEGTVDTDGDGIPNYRDLDSDGDGKSDATEGNIDTDSDGTPNYLDLDSDGDGVLDSVDQCPLISGIGSTSGCPPDSDGDGLADVDDSDDDNDGILDTVEAAACSPSAVDCDTDGDGIPNRLDLDSDGDGIKDIIESNGTDADNDGRADGAVDSNGVPASANGGLTPPNTDGTGNSNPYDTDSDGDGILDAIEKGTGSTLADTDNDNIPDYLDTDSDGDGISDAVEGSVDTDGDGIPNFRDLDSDGDGIPDINEGVTDTDGDGIPNYKDLDSDGDGIADAIEDAGCLGIVPCTPTNSDNDNIPDYLDADSDNDGIPDAIEKGPTGTPVDTDSDGTPDYLDTDSDGDGILDSVEDAGCTGTVPCTPTDTDGDGIPNFRDLDSDGDGISDATEGTTDTDNDGRPNYLDVDSDGDGISDALEGNIDSDSDGIPNYLDLDSDADGIPDAIEKGPTSTPVDSDNDGTPDYLDLDTDGDGIPDSVEDAACSGTTCTPTDSDNDGIPNHRDLDSDGDGIPDSVEKGANGSSPDNTDGALGPDYLDTDSDNDGILDAEERGIDGNNPLDTDGDYIPDYKEVDSDNDGIPDAIEGTVDTDGDGIPDYRDLDSDNDGILDATEDAGCIGTAPCTPTDTDGDGIPNYKDLDSDRDNKSDQSEGETDYDGDTTPNYLDPDSDGDGINDIDDQCPLLAGVLANNGCPDDTDADGIYDINDLDDDNDGIVDTAEAAACSPSASDCDTDLDGIPNRLDPDSDNDGISDVRESNGTDVDGDGKVDGAVDADGVPSSTNGGLTPPNTDGTTLPDPYDTDSDGDGISDALEKGPNGNTPVDTDGDGIPDYRDTDSDNDGIPDSVERGTGAAILDTDGDGIPDYRDTDSDNDGITDAVEKGPSGATPLDTDLDGIPNYRDLDSDGDGMTDATEGTVDTDGDGKPNYIDVDSDGDGILDSIEKGFNPASPVDTDGDGIPNYKDLDSDGDGIPDAVEGTTDTDGDGIPNYLDTDSDGDGILDSIEDDGCTGTAPCTPTDTDGDGIPNYLDLDTDGDGKTDAVEKGPGATPMDSDGDGVPDYRDVDNLGKPDVNVTNKSVPVSGNVKTNDPVPAGTTYGQPAQLAGATLTMNANGTYTFTSAVPGKYVYYVSVCGPNQTSGCPQTPLEITVLDPLLPDAPVSNNDHVTMEQGTVKTVNVLANDKAGEVNNALVPSSLSITTAPAHGTTLINSDGTIRYTPSPYFVGTDSLVYSICDNQNPALCKPAVLYFTVEAAGAPAVTTAVDDYNNIVAGSPATGSLLTNDSNTTGAALTASVVTGPSSAQGTFTMNADGTYTFTPTAGFSGPVDIVYQACTTGNICSKATLHILVDPAPVLVDDTASCFANVPVSGNISTNDVVRVGTTYGQPAAITGATIVVGPSGTYTFTATVAGTYTYTIPVCAPGQTVNCPTETLVITVTAPAPVDDAVSAFANVPKSGNVSTNDVIPTGSTYGQPTQQTGATITVNADGTYTFTATVAGTYTYIIPVCAPGQTSNCPTETLVITVNEPGPVNDTETAITNVAKTGDVSTNDLNPAGTTFGQPAAITGATITVNADGTYSFTATAAGTYTYTIPVCAPGQTSNCPTETLVITVTAPTVTPPPVTPPPVTPPALTKPIVQNDYATTPMNVPVIIPVLVNDSSTNTGKVINVSSARVTVEPVHCTAVFNADGTLTYTPAIGFVGTDSLTYSICDDAVPANCQTGVVYITVTAVPPVVPYLAPTTNPDMDATNINVPVSGNVSTNDAPGATYGQPAQQSGATITVNANGTYSFTATIPGVYTYLVPACPTGQTTNCPMVPLVITVSDPLKDSNSPVANTDLATVNAGSSVTTKVLANDNAANPAASLNPASLAIVTNGANGTAVVNSDGTITYTPKAGFTGVDEITYKICDNSTPVLCSTAKVVYTIQPVAEPAKTFATDDYNSTPAGSPASGSVLANDGNTAGETLTATIVSGVSAAEGTLVFKADGTYTFTPAPGFSGPVDVVYAVCSASNVCTKATLHLVVNPAPVLTPDFNATLIGIPVNGSAATNDVVPAGSTFGQPASISGASLQMNPDGTYVFSSTTPGTYEYLVPVCAKAQTTNCPLVPLVITVSDPNAITNPPIANADVVSVAAGSPVTTNVLANDQAANVGGVLVYSTLAITNAPLNGSAKVNADGTITYTPAPGFVGTDVLTYTVCDNSQPALCKTAKVYYTIGASASKNLLASDDFATTQGGVVSGNVLGNDKSSTGSALTATAVTNVDPAKGSFSLTPSGAYTFTPAAGYVGPVDIVYSVCSSEGVCTQATLHITVLPVPDMIAPQAITPNGDGKNDTLIFRGLPGLNIENRLTIYNRWGNIVFSTGNYQNNWSGQTDNAFGALATDSQLPDGTYYYILDFFGARPNLGNYVYLDRSSK